MKTNTKVSFGMAALVAAGMIGLLPASADKGAPTASVEVTMTAVVMASPETPQDQVWDMTYGAEQPAIEQEIAQQAAIDESIVDYALG